MADETILVVEDESIISMHIEATLKKLGYRVVPASSGEEALRRAAEHPPDLALMDIMLGEGVDGIETAEQLRTLGIPIVYLTGNADEKTVQRARMTEPLGYILKPLHEQQLKANIQIALARSGIEKKLRAQQSWYKAVLESVEDGVVIVDLDRKVTFMNQAAEAAAGVTADAARGKDALELFSSLDPGLRSRLEEAVETVLQTGAAASLAGPAILLNRTPGAEFQVEAVLPMQPGHDNSGTAVIILRPHLGGEAVAEESAPVELSAPAPAPAPATAAALGTPSPPVQGRGQDELVGLPTRAAAERAITDAFGQ
ncbi:MAG: response regulator, partial [Acidobacteria bacterium]|nr:response regulator [Acidobacteriota bacterium]